MTRWAGSGGAGVSSADSRSVSEMSTSVRHAASFSLSADEDQAGSDGGSDGRSDGVRRGQTGSDGGQTGGQTGVRRAVKQLQVDRGDGTDD